MSPLKYKSEFDNAICEVALIENMIWLPANTMAQMGGAETVKLRRKEYLNEFRRHSEVFIRNPNEAIPYLTNILNLCSKGKVHLALKPVATEIEEDKVSQTITIAILRILYLMPTKQSRDIINECTASHNETIAHCAKALKNNPIEECIPY